MAKGERRFFGDPTPIQRDYLIEEFRSGACACGFEGSVHIQVGAADGIEEARWVQSVHDASGGWPTAQVAFCDLTSQDIKRNLAALAEIPTIRGIRQIVGRAPGEDARTGTNALLENAAFERGITLAAEAGFSFDLQLTPELMPKCAELFGRIPQLNVALCHAGSPHDRSNEGMNSWAKGMERFSELPNVWCKLSGLAMFRHGWNVNDIRPIVETCLALFGSGRCMFGSNFPVDSLQSDYATVVEAYREIVPAAEHAAVFGGTACEFYGIHP